MKFKLGKYSLSTSDLKRATQNKEVVELKKLGWIHIANAISQHPNQTYRDLVLGGGRFSVKGSYNPEIKEEDFDHELAKTFKKNSVANLKKAHNQSIAIDVAKLVNGDQNKCTFYINANSAGYVDYNETSNGELYAEVTINLLVAAPTMPGSSKYKLPGKIKSYSVTVNLNADDVKFKLEYLDPSNQILRELILGELFLTEENQVFIESFVELDDILTSDFITPELKEKYENEIDKIIQLAKLEKANFEDLADQVYALTLVARNEVVRQTLLGTQNANVNEQDDLTEYDIVLGRHSNEDNQFNKFLHHVTSWLTSLNTDEKPIAATFDQLGIIKFLEQPTVNYAYLNRIANSNAQFLFSLANTDSTLALFKQIMDIEDLFSHDYFDNDCNEYMLRFSALLSSLAEKAENLVERALVETQKFFAEVLEIAVKRIFREGTNKLPGVAARNCDVNHFLRFLLETDELARKLPAEAYNKFKKETLEVIKSPAFYKLNLSDRSDEIYYRFRLVELESAVSQASGTIFYEDGAATLEYARAIKAEIDQSQNEAPTANAGQVKPRSKEELYQLIDILGCSTTAIKDPWNAKNLNKLEDYSNKVKGKPYYWKMLGGALLGLVSAAIVVGCVLAFVPSGGLSMFGIAGGSVLMKAAIGTVALASTAGSATYSHHSRRSGFSDALYGLWQSAKTVAKRPQPAAKIYKDTQEILDGFEEFANGSKKAPAPKLI